MPKRAAATPARPSATHGCGKDSPTKGCGQSISRSSSSGSWPKCSASRPTQPRRPVAGNATGGKSMSETEVVHRFAADVMFLNPRDVPRAREALAAIDCEYEIDHDAIDVDSGAVFGMVTGMTD